MRKVIIAGNWKMNKTVAESAELAGTIKAALVGLRNIEVVLCPPYTSLSAVQTALSGSSIGLGGQDVFWEKEGAFTGEVSSAMLTSVGCAYVIIGHSERRALFHETNETVNKKVMAALKAGLTPIVCVGETLKERQSGKTFAVIKDHIENSLKGLTDDQILKTVIAYEPVWAIGTGINATPEQAEESHRYIRELLTALHNKEVAESVRIQYGGSVNPGNIESLIREKDVDGALVGGASLKADSFIDIVTISSHKPT